MQLELQEFNYLVELFRFYLGLVLETVTFVLGVTGAVVAYVLQDGRSPSRWPGLIVPCALCVFVGAGFLAATPAAWELKLRVDALAPVGDAASLVTRELTLPNDGKVLALLP